MNKAKRYVSYTSTGLRNRPEKNSWDSKGYYQSLTHFINGRDKMANITPEHQKKFDNIIKQIYTALDPIYSDPIITALKELWEEIKSADNDQ